MLSPPPAQAAVSDNVVLSSIEQSIGEGNGDTIFGLLRSIWNKVSITFEKVELLEAKIDTQTSMLNDLTLATKNQTALAGGGCYYTLHTRREYLNGYKLRLSDGTSSKSCYIAYDADSNYWSGVLKAPLKDNVTVEIINSSTDTSQGKMSTTVSTTNGFAMIDLDALLDANYADLLDVNDSLATAMYCDRSFTKDEAKLPTIVEKVVTYDGHLQDLVRSNSDVTISSTNLDLLYKNPDEFLDVLKSDIGNYLISNSDVGVHISNDKILLRAIGSDTLAVNVCEQNVEFCEYLKNTALLTVTQTETAGVRNEVTGNLLCVSVTSGCKGDYSAVNPLQLYYKHTVTMIDGTPNHYGIYFNTRGVSMRGNSTISKGGTVSNVIDSENRGLFSYTWFYYTDATYTTVTRTQVDTFNTANLNLANKTVNVFRFADKITVEEYADCTVASVTGWGCNIGNQYVSTPRANSIITYIDLNE